MTNDQQELSLANITPILKHSKYTLVMAATRHSNYDELKPFFLHFLVNLTAEFTIWYQFLKPAITQFPNG